IRASVDADSITAVKVNRVVAASGEPTDGVAGGTTRYEHAMTDIAQGASPGRVRPNEVALEKISRSDATGDGDAVAFIPGNDVPGPSRHTANRVAKRTAVELDATQPVPQGLRTRQVRADEIALDRVPNHAGTFEMDAIPCISRDDVERAGERSANRVVGGT